MKVIRPTIINKRIRRIRGWCRVAKVYGDFVRKSHRGHGTFPYLRIYNSQGKLLYISYPQYTRAQKRSDDDIARKDIFSFSALYKPTATSANLFSSSPCYLPTYLSSIVINKQERVRTTRKHTHSNLETFFPI